MEYNSLNRISVGLILLLTTISSYIFGFELFLITIIIISNNGNKRKGMKQLLNTSREYNIYESVEDYSEIMLDSLETV